MIAYILDFWVRHPVIVAYMLQNTEYEVLPFLKWYWRTQNFGTVMNRRVLDRTRRARMLLLVLRWGMLLQLATGATSIYVGFTDGHSEFVYFGIALVLSYPIIWAHLVLLPLLLAKVAVVGPKNAQAVTASERIFKEHPAAKIAVTGSYGKTSMKELLTTILGEHKHIAATPANKNVAVSHAVFARKLSGEEEVLILEYGEGAPGDVTRFAKSTHPTHAIITGLAPAHLDKYKTLEAAAKDIFSVADFVAAEHVYVNEDSAAAAEYLKPGFHAYSKVGIDGWQVDKVHISMDGTSFILENGTQKLKLHSKLLGRHQIGPISAAAALALELGLTEKQVEEGVQRTKPFEHRMQPYKLGGAWIIDDTYNGNLEGITAGVALLKDLRAKRKWYVTPGLVDQGKETAAIHEKIGGLIATARPDIVVLMQNSVTKYIQNGLQKAGYSGEIRIESEPLDFYTNLDQFVRSGDIVLMQNDWTDNYA